MKIFAQLGGDETIFYQFGIFCLIFILLKWVFLGKLQFVIETRENKTTKLEESADEKFKKSEVLFNQYRDEIQAVRGANLEILEKAQAEAMARQKATLKKVEERIEQSIQKKRAEFQEEVDSKRQSVFRNAGELSKKLIDKIMD